MSSPTMIEILSPLSVTQTLISDCSFLASLAACAAYERKFHKRLLTCNIFPKNKNGHPIYNRYGKYLVKLQLNGVARKVICVIRLNFILILKLILTKSGKNRVFMWHEYIWGYFNNGYFINMDSVRDQSITILFFFFNASTYAFKGNYWRLASSWF